MEIEKYIKSTDELCKLYNMNNPFDFKNPAGKDFYPYMENQFLKTENIEEIVLELKNKIPKNIRICDLGFGLGKIIFSFSYFFKKYEFNVECDGIEICKDYIDIFENNLRKNWEDSGIELNIYNKDLMEHDISNYDMVYLYHPLRDFYKMKDFFCGIADKLKSGAVLFDPYRNDVKFDTMDLYEVGRFHVWIKH